VATQALDLMLLLNQTRRAPFAAPDHRVLPAIVGRAHRFRLMESLASLKQAVADDDLVGPWLI